MTDAPLPRDASTVMLLRDGADGIEVFLQRRVGEMAFAAGVTVFPGGRVDPSDGDRENGWSGPPVSWWAKRFGVDEPRAMAAVCAAVRETFEECGVLLAGPTHDSVVADTSSYRQARVQLEAREFTFAEFLAREKLVLRADLLRPWANWITPVGEPRRYDTRFFAAVVPEGQLADGATTEADKVVWQTPADALEQWRTHGSELLPPTWAQLTTLATYATTADVLAAEPEIPVILPQLRIDGSHVSVDFPGDSGYAARA